MGKIDKRQQQIDKSIQRYPAVLDTAACTQPVKLEARNARLQDKIAMLRKQMQVLEQVNGQLKKLPEKQLSMTDPDARSMATIGRGSSMVAYNVQVAVDAKHHLIVAHQDTHLGHDRSTPASMALAARKAMGNHKLQTIADRDYYSNEQIKACEDTGVTAILPRPNTSGTRAQGRFERSDFVYNQSEDEYQCPAGRHAIYRFTREENGLQIRRYWSSACTQCMMKSSCTPSDDRRISRWEHENMPERAQQRLEQMPNVMMVRRRTVEHVFGTLENWMGHTHFLTK